MIDKLLNNKKLQKTTEFILFLLVFAITLVYVAMAFVQYINSDAAFYLGVVNSIHEGLVPIRDFPLFYTPLSFYLLQIVRIFTHDYTVYISVLFLFIIASSFVLYQIVHKLSANRILSLSVQLLFLIQVFIYEGTFFVLGPFVVFFGLLSIWFLLEKEKGVKYILLSGIFAGASFMSKQYGLAFFAGCLVYLVFSAGEYKNKIKETLYLSLGFAIIPLLFVIYFMLSGVDFWTIILCLSGGDYGQRTESNWLKGVLRLFNYRHFLTIFLLLLPFVLYKNKHLIPLALSLFVTAFLLTFQFYFQIFAHYYVLIIPLILTLFSLIFLYDNKHVKLGVILLLFLSSCYLGGRVVRRTHHFINTNPRIEQVQQANRIQEKVKDTDVVFILGAHLVSDYFLLNKKPALFSIYGYSFGFETEKEIVERIKYSTVLISETQHLNNLTSNSQNIDSIIRDGNFQVVYQSEHRIVLRRCPN